MLQIGIAESIIHERFDPESFANDIALLRLRRPARFNPAVGPVCLPVNEREIASRLGVSNLNSGLVGKNTTVIGWGRQYAGSQGSFRVGVSFERWIFRF